MHLGKPFPSNLVSPDVLEYNFHHLLLEDLAWVSLLYLKDLLLEIVQSTLELPEVLLEGVPNSMPFYSS